MKKNAFTFLELLIVMSIIALLFGSGVAGLLRLRASMEAEQATNQLLSILKAEQNKAKNNVNNVELGSSFPDISKKQFDYVFGVWLHFTGALDFKLEKRICWRLISPGASWTTPIATRNCTSPEEISISGAAINFSTIVPGYTPCIDIIFENLSEKIFIITPTSGDCKIGIETETFKSPDLPYKYLTFYRVGYYDVKMP